MSRECPQSVPGHLFDTLGTLSGHFLHTPEPRARRAPSDTPSDTPSTSPIFRDRRARETPVAGRPDRNSRKSSRAFRPGSLKKVPKRSEKSPRKLSENQESPRETKPKKGQFMNFSQGHSGTKVHFCESCLFSQGKQARIFTEKWAKFMNFSFCPFLWFALPEKSLI